MCEEALHIVEWFKPDVLVGGFHFMNLECSDELKAYAKQLDSYDTVYYTGHCTGVKQYEYMEPFMKNLHYISAGRTIEI